MTSEPPALSSHRAGVPRQLESVVARTMRILPEQRYRTVDELRQAIVPFTTARGVAQSLARDDEKSARPTS